MMNSKYLLFILIFFISCQSDPQSNISEPEIDLSDFILQDNFQIELIASEPLIEAPVAMTFDNQGRVWVMEMPDYMPNIHGSDEDVARGRIVILEDKNGNGRMDHAKVFLEKLHQPRAMALVYGGLLYAEAPNLFFVEIENDQPKNRVLVDSLYAIGGNVEHQPNGLIMNLDNWIYNAKSNFRYRRVDGVWKKEPTHFRGQWGITRDDYGRLFYNDNSNPLYGDYVMPNQMTRNKFLHPKEGVGKNICVDRSLNPLQSTAVNRGYMDGMLDENGKLVSFTSACSPMIYRGNDFEEDYKGNAFVCAPEINAIKRIKLSENDAKIEGQPAWNDKEFLITTDEGFRPVNLNNAPDGSFYITDMHRGIIQHKVYMTAYLKKQIEERELDTIINSGRIFRVFQKENKSENIDLEKLGNEDLCDVLKNKNGWLRDRAQQLLIHRNATDAIEKLKSIATNSENHLAQIHAYWILEGLDSLDEMILLEVKNDWHPKVIASTIKLLENFPNKLTYSFSEKILKKYNHFFQLKNKEIDLQIALSVNEIENPKAVYELLLKINKRYPDDELIAEATASSLQGEEKSVLAYIYRGGSDVLKNKLKQVVANIKNDNPNRIFNRIKIGMDDKTVGRDLFNIHCAACHGIGGEGIQNLAPSLLAADLVEMNSEVVTSIILHGLQGEITIEGKLVKFQAAMPGLKDNDELTDEKIAAITAYVKNAFSLTPQGIQNKRVKELRNEIPESGSLFSEKELVEKYKK
ncbi:MAG: c-type cytochrome [Saprospiraceae bacterium]